MISFLVCNRLIELMGRGGHVKLSEHTAKLRLKTAFFGRSKLLWDDELSQVHQCLMEVLETLLEDHGGGRRDGIERGRGFEHTEG